MPITIACASCKTPLNVGDQFAGQRVKCPRCSQPVLVAAAAAAPAAARAAGPAPAAPLPGNPTPAALVTFKCPGCSCDLKVKPEMAGKTFKCPKCTKPVTVPTKGAPPAPPRPAPAMTGNDWIDVNEEYVPGSAPAARDAPPPTGDWGQGLMQPHDVPDEMQEHVRKTLNTNERLVWFDRPQLDVLMSRARKQALSGVLLIFIALIVLPGLGFIIFRETKGEAVGWIALGVVGFMALALIAGAIFAFGTPGRTRRGAAKRPCYILTNRRLLVHPGLGMQTQMSQDGMHSLTAWNNADKTLPYYSGLDMQTMTRLEDKTFAGSGELLFGLTVFDEPVRGVLTAVGNVVQAEKALREQLLNPIADKLLRGELSLKDEFGRAKEKEKKEDEGEILPSEGNLKTYMAKMPADPANLKPFRAAIEQELSTATPQQRQQVEAELTEGERALWIGTPEGKGVVGGLFSAAGLSKRREPEYTLYAITNRRVLLWYSRGSREGKGIVFGKKKHGPISYYPPRLVDAGLEDVNKNSGSVVFRKVRYIVRSQNDRGVVTESETMHYFGLLHVRNVQPVSRLLFDTLIRPCRHN